jgi:hypothetical protein
MRARDDEVHLARMTGVPEPAFSGSGGEARHTRGGGTGFRAVVTWTVRSCTRRAGQRRVNRM